MKYLQITFYFCPAEIRTLSAISDLAMIKCCKSVTEATANTPDNDNITFHACVMFGRIYLTA